VIRSPSTGPSPRCPAVAVVVALCDRQRKSARYSSRATAGARSEIGWGQSRVRHRVGSTRHRLDVGGLIWHSRRTEWNNLPRSEAVLLFGHGYPRQRGSGQRVGGGSIASMEGSGRVLTDE
jgi:hypothetical protein